MTHRRTEYTEEDLLEHLRTEHARSPFAEYLKEIVYGGVDGIVTTFAVVAGFSGAQAGDPASTLPLVAVLLFGSANLFADATSMGLGSFLSVRADQDVFDKEKEKELFEVRNSKDMEYAETIHILQSKGFSQQDAKKLADIFSKNEDYWVDFMMKDELEMTDPSGEKPIVSGLSTFLSFIVFGSIPLIPYVVLKSLEAGNLFMYSIIFTAFAMVLLGLLRWKVTNQTILRSVGETVLLGGVSAGIAFFVGTLFKA